MDGAVLIAIAATIGNLLQGWDNATIAGAVIYIKKEFSLQTEPTIEGLIVAMSLIGATIITTCSGSVSDRCGRRPMLILSSILYFIGGLVMLWSPNVYVLLLARLIDGFGVGLAVTLIPVYISETSPPEIRGQLNTLPQFCGSGGMFLSYCMVFAMSLMANPNWRVMLGVLSVPSLVYLVLTIFFLPESPRWLVSKGRMLEAKNVLQRLRRREDVSGQVFTDVVGSPYYVAPEVLCKHYGPESDVWTAGVILYILLSGVPPFWAETQQGIFDAVLTGHIDFDLEPWPLISDSAKDLIRKMLCPRSQDRLSAHEVLFHPWICQNGVAPDRALDPAVLSRLKQFSAMNKLKKMALRVIAESLSEEEIAGLREMFLAMDTDSSGAITFDELKAGLRRYGSTLKDTEIRDLMDAADVDNSGTIDYGEFIAATVHLNKLEREEHLVAAFSYFDKDGSGYLTVDELQQACKEHNMNDVFIEDIIKEVDQDNDGRIDYGEFVAMMRKGNIGSMGLPLGRRTMRNSLRMSTRE